MSHSSNPMDQPGPRMPDSEVVDPAAATLGDLQHHMDDPRTVSRVLHDVLLDESRARTRAALDNIFERRRAERLARAVFGSGSRQGVSERYSNRTDGSEDQ